MFPDQTEKGSGLQGLYREEWVGVTESHEAVGKLDVYVIKVSLRRECPPVPQRVSRISKVR